MGAPQREVTGHGAPAMMRRREAQRQCDGTAMQGPSARPRAQKREREREEKLGFRLAGGWGRVFVPPISAPGCLIETLAIGRPAAAGLKSAHVGSARRAAFPAQAQVAAKGGGRGRPRACKAAVGRPAKAERVYFRSLGAEAKEKKSIFCPCFRSICNYSY